MTRDSINMRDLIESPWCRQAFGIRWKLAEDANTKLALQEIGGWH